MVYADYNATAPILPEVFAAMKPFLTSEYGNPSSNSSLGQTASDAVEKARSQLASLINAKPKEIVFLSGGTESCFQALMGSYLAGAKRFASVHSEHTAVLRTMELLSAEPFFAEVEYLSLRADGSLESLDFGDVDLVSLMLANNETGLVHPVEALSAKAIHCDATQALGKIEVDFQKLGVDFLSVSGHKIGAPKGIGALVIREGANWKPPMIGGAQENGRRGGTLAVSNIVGFGAAAEAAARNLSEIDVSLLRDAFEKEITASIEGVEINAEDQPRIPNTSSLYIPGIVSHEAVEKLAGRSVMISAGSACSAKGLSYSHVLKAMGQSELKASGTLRVSFGQDQSEEDAVFVARAIAEYAREAGQGVEKDLELLLSD